MKIFFNDETVWDFDKMGESVQDLFQKVTPFGNVGGLAGSAMEHLDDFTLRAIERRVLARRDTLNDALDLIHHEGARRHTTPPEKIG